MTAPFTFSDAAEIVMPPTLRPMDEAPEDRPILVTLRARGREAELVCRAGQAWGWGQSARPVSSVSARLGRRVWFPVGSMTPWPEDCAVGWREANTGSEDAA